MMAAPSRSAPHHRPRRARLWLLAGCLSACTAADNLSYGEITAELDGIARIEGSGASRRLSYAESAPTSAWYMRNPLTVPVRWLLGAAFGVRHERRLENPSGHVRELLVELVDEAGSGLLQCGDAIARYCLIAELDASAANRIVALDGACAVIDRLGLRLFEGPLEQIGTPADAARLETARMGIQLARPENRRPGPMAGDLRATYTTALATLVERQLDTWSERLGVVGDLCALRQREPDESLHATLDDCLRQALRHTVQWTLLRAVQGRGSQFAEVRICAMQLIRRLGGPRVVPLLLATMAATASEVRDQVATFDPDPLVQLQLIHLCGQLRGEAALTSVRLPGRQAWEAVSPADFLARIAWSEQDYYSRLRVPALTALCLCLDKPRLDYDVAWVQAWWRERQSRL